MGATGTGSFVLGRLGVRERSDVGVKGEVLRNRLSIVKCGVASGAIGVLVGNCRICRTGPRRLCFEVKVKGVALRGLRRILGETRSTGGSNDLFG